MIRPVDEPPVVAAHQLRIPVARDIVPRENPCGEFAPDAVIAALVKTEVERAARPGHAAPLESGIGILHAAVGKKRTSLCLAERLDGPSCTEGLKGIFDAPHDRGLHKAHGSRADVEFPRVISPLYAKRLSPVALHSGIRAGTQAARTEGRIPGRKRADAPVHRIGAHREPSARKRNACVGHPHPLREIRIPRTARVPQIKKSRADLNVLALINVLGVSAKRLPQPAIGFVGRAHRRRPDFVRHLGRLGESRSMKTLLADRPECIKAHPCNPGVVSEIERLLVACGKHRRRSMRFKKFDRLVTPPRPVQNAGELPDLRGSKAPP